MKHPGSLVALLLVACSSTVPEPQPASTPVVDIDHVELRGLLLLLGDRRQYESFTVDRSIELGPEMRRQVAVTLGRIGDPRGTQALLELLVDPEPEVRRAAAFALGLLGDPGTTRALLVAARDPDRETGVLAIEALARLEAELETVVDSLDALSADEFFARMLPPLFRFPEDRSFPVAREALSLEDPSLRAGAVYALARNPLDEGAPLLRAELANPDPWLRGWAARALGSVGGAGDLELVRPLLEDQSAGPTIQALRAAKRLVETGRVAPPADWKNRLLELCVDPRVGVRITALEASAAWLLDEELGELLGRVAAEGEGREREVALLALAGAGDPRARDLVARASNSQEPTLRARAASAAGRLEDGKLLAILGGDEVAAVRATAIGELLELEEPGDAEVWADRALADEDPVVRSTAFEWLEEHPVVPFDRIVWALQGAGTRWLVEARLAGLRALVARAEAVPEERAQIIEALQAVASRGEYPLRRAAGAGLGELGVMPPPLGTVQTAGTAQTYKELVQRSWPQRCVRLGTRHGDLVIRLATREAPLTSLNFLRLVNQGFYDGLTFHRVVPDFVVQGGDPRGDGYGGPGYTIRDEINRLRYRRGVVGMALAGADTGGSQFFIALSPQPHLDGGYTAFGKVVEGEPLLDRIVQGDRIERAVEEADGSC